MSEKLDNTILNDFIKESLILVDQCVELLESIEGSPSEVEKLNDFANRIDRVMGGAKSLALMLSPQHPMHLIGDYCAVCKSVGYQGAKIQNNDQLYDVTIALLLDAVEMIKTLFNKLDSSAEELKRIFSTTFLERLRWISQRFEEIAKKDSPNRMQQNEIDELLKKLGI